jgi:poly-gamma-glutamate synthesis protein (capsule biosynthesis protein)
MAPRTNAITISLCGDLMTGRGIDQVLPDPCPPQIHESYVRDARDYVRVAEQENGPIARPVGLSEPWGDVLAELESVAPDVLVVNLETALTRSEEAWPGKGIHYRTSPENARMLVEADVDCCVLANNHVLDWDRPGLEDTTTTLDIRRAGAGTNLMEAEAPAVIELEGGGRVLVFSIASESSGVFGSWTAIPTRSSVQMIGGCASAHPTQGRAISR